jgi:hypothetical protein
VFLKIIISVKETRASFLLLFCVRKYKVNCKNGVVIVLILFPTTTTTTTTTTAATQSLTKHYT